MWAINHCRSWPKSLEALLALTVEEGMRGWQALRAKLTKVVLVMVDIYIFRGSIYLGTKPVSVRPNSGRYPVTPEYIKPGKHLPY